MSAQRASTSNHRYPTQAIERLQRAEPAPVLPGMKGSGAVRDLHEAAMQNPELRERLAA